MKNNKSLLSTVVFILIRLIECLVFDRITSRWFNHLYFLDS